MKFIGRLFNVGIAKESVRGTAVNPTFWYPSMTVSLDDKVTQVTDDSSVGVIEDAENAEVSEKWAEGELNGRIDNTKFGLLVLATLGTETSQAAHAGETIVYDHIFNVNESAQHPTLTISAQEPNSTGVRYTLAGLVELTVEAALKKYATYKAKFRSNASAAGVVTPAYTTTENAFLPQHINAYFATNLAGLTGAAAILVKSFKLSIKKNLEDDFVLGSVVAVDRLNKQFEVEGEIELMYNDRSYIDSVLMSDTAQALRLRLINTGVTLGTGTNPTITIDMAKVKLAEVARKLDDNGMVTQTLKFKAFYSLTDSKMITMTVVNLQSTAY